MKQVRIVKLGYQYCVEKSSNKVQWCRVIAGESLRCARIIETAFVQIGFESTTKKNIRNAELKTGDWIRCPKCKGKLTYIEVSEDDCFFSCSCGYEQCNKCEKPLGGCNCGKS